MSFLLPEVETRVPLNTHPGLQLDKYSAPSAQEEGKESLEKVVGVAARDGEASARRAFEAFRDRRKALLESTSARRAIATCRTPLTLHLARASAHENAGIALHRTGGFPVLPGTGVKGMARAYAEFVGRGEADEEVRRIFGPRLRPGSSDAAEAGSVVFHDAWPVEWPRLVVDITNSHHPEYYRTSGEAAPGDWEGPVPVYFLAVAPGTKFELAVAPRDAATRDQDVTLALECLRGALAHLGVGAKTAAGYGWMDVADAPARPRGEVVRHTLELVTPAFLAGALQGKEDCDLRSSTLRGLLRWWWRTMHVGFLDSRDLHRLEGAIFGSTDDGQSAFDLVLTRTRRVEPAQPAYKNRAFQDLHGIRVRSKTVDGRVKKLGTGIAYAAYGMADSKDRPPRWAIEAGASWSLELRFHAARRIAKRKNADPLDGRELPPELVRTEVESALFLLCHFGGLGAKERKGFGSLATPPGLSLSLPKARERASATRLALGLPDVFDPGKVKGACTLQLLAETGPERPFLEVALPVADRWAAMDRIGQVLQDGAALHAHREAKLALGLPRAIHGPRREPMDHQDARTHRPQQWLSSDGLDRHSSPVHVSLDRSADGKLVVRVLAFVAGRLSTQAASRAFLTSYLAELEKSLRGTSPETAAPPRPAQPRGGSFPGHGRPGQAGPRGAPGRPTGIRPAQGPREVEVELIAEKTKKGGWRGRILDEPGRSGFFHDSADLPADAKPGHRIRAVVKATSPSGDWTLLIKK